MTYNRNIPQATDNISVSQGQILSNFQAIDSGTTGEGIGFARDHITMTDASNGGMHNIVDYYVNQSSDPTLSGVSALYTKSVSSLSQLFFRNSSAILQLTGAATVANPGSVFLPGGLIMKFGNFGMAFGVVSQEVTYPTPFTTAYYSVVLTSSSSNSLNTAGISTSLTDETGFTAIRASAPASSLTYFYIALGS